MSQLIRSISGLRGIIGEHLTPDAIANYAHAFGKFCDGGAIVIGYDGRPSGTAIKDVIRAALVLRGNDVTDIGMAPTPTVQLMTEHSDASGGIAITASHNPSEWNGMKFISARGIFLDADENARLFALADAPRQTYAQWDSLGHLTVDSTAMDVHLSKILSYPLLDLARIRERRFRIVVDAVNASGSIIVPKLLDQLNCEVFPIACDGSGIFPHIPEPIPVNLTMLGEAVRTLRADLGIAVDPDADRLVLFDEKGNPFGEEYTITMAIDAVLAQDPSAASRQVAVNLSTTRAVDDVARKYGAGVVRTPVGEINVVKRMLEISAPIGGEGSGGVILTAIHAGRDSLVGIALALNRLAALQVTASEYRASLPAYVIHKAKYPLGVVTASQLLSRVAQEFAGERINRDDGVRIDFAEGWVHLRTSNTEPILRLIAEGPSREVAATLAKKVETVIFT
jgi:phosphomannomutase